MITQLNQDQKRLYDADYNLWLLQTIEQLENKDFNALDLENLIEEVSELSKREKKKLKNLLRRLFEHLLKLKYWQSEIKRNQAHWQGEIRKFRQQIQDELEDSPSLKNYVNDVLETCYQDSRKIVSDKSKLPLATFPDSPIATIEQILDENWLP